MTVRLTTIRVQASSNISALRKMGRDPLVIKATRVDAAYGLVNLMSAAYQATPGLCDRKRGMPPCFIAYGRREDILDNGAVAETIKRLPDLPPDQFRLVVYRNGYHLLLRDLDSRKVFDDIAAWIDDHGAICRAAANMRGQKKARLNSGPRRLRRRHFHLLQFDRNLARSLRKMAEGMGFSTRRCRTKLHGVME